MTQFKLVDGELHLEAYGDVKKVLKGWESMTGWYWFATELDVDGIDGQYFGYVQGSYPEWGYFSQAEFDSCAPLIWEIKEVDLPYSGRRHD